MCGIFGYISSEKKCKKIVLEGLSRLEYRGYDSAGFVCIDQKHKHLSFAKEAGTLSVLQKVLENDIHDGLVGMGHTRWATHGAANKINAHPQFDCTNSIAVVHNGVIENHDKLKEKLLNDDHEFRSATDTEVVAHLLESILQSGKTINDSVVEVVKELHGIYALVIILEQLPNQLLLVKYKSPLSIGIGDKEMFVSSDPIAFSDKTDKVIFMPDKSFAILTADSAELFDFEGKPIKVQTQQFNIKFSAANKQGFDHFMLKEIYEQKKVIDHTISFYESIEGSEIWYQLGIASSTIRELEKIELVAAGTSWHSGLIAQFFFENICNIPTTVHLSSEFRYKKFFPQNNSLFITISQSGETADTLECLRHVNSHNIPTVALTNVASSTMVREAGGFLIMQAGPEISVASTKAFTCQLASLYWLANRIAVEKGLKSNQDLIAAGEDILVAAEVLESSIENNKWEISQNLANEYSKYDRFIFLGRNISYPFALEAALKLKEVSYIFAQAWPAGELKHGPIALIDYRTPVVIFSSLDKLIYQKLLSNVQEVKARNGHIFSFAFDGQNELINLSDKSFILPHVNPLLTPIAMAGLMQFFVYNISKELGHPIDKPRNLAKSVTVE